MHACMHRFVSRRVTRYTVMYMYHGIRRTVDITGRIEWVGGGGDCFRGDTKFSFRFLSYPLPPVCFGIIYMYGTLTAYQCDLLLKWYLDHNYRTLSNTTYGKKIISILKNARFSGKGRQPLHIYTL